MSTVAARYCSFTGIPSARFERRVLFRSLTWQAQLLFPLLRLLPGFFAADLELIRDVGRAANLRDFALDAADFKLHPDNSRPLRRLFRLRVSSRKLRRHLAPALEASAASVESLAT